MVVVIAKAADDDAQVDKADKTSSREEKRKEAVAARKKLLEDERRAKKEAIESRRKADLAQKADARQIDAQTARRAKRKELAGTKSIPEAVRGARRPLSAPVSTTTTTAKTSRSKRPSSSHASPAGASRSTSSSKISELSQPKQRASPGPPKKSPARKANVSGFLDRQAERTEEAREKMEMRRAQLQKAEAAQIREVPKLNPPRKSKSASSEADFITRQELRMEERKHRLEEKRKLRAQEEGVRQPQLSRRSLELASKANGDQRLARLTAQRSPRALERMDQKRREIERENPLRKSPPMNEASRRLIAQSTNKRVKEPPLQRLARRTSSYENRLPRHGEKKEVIVYRGWKRSVEYVPIDETGRPLGGVKPSRSASTSSGLDSGPEKSPAGPLRTRSVGPVTPRSRAKQRRDADIEAELHISKLERKLRLAQSELDKARSELVRERNGKKRLQQARREAEGDREQIAAAFSLSQAKLQHLQAQLAEMQPNTGSGDGNEL